jgi:hypothetical protein
VTLQGVAAGSDIQMCGLDGGQKGLDEVLAPARRVFKENFSNNVDEGFGVVILSGGASHLEDAVCDKGGKVLNREYEIRARVDSGHTEGDGARRPDFAREQ